MRRIPFDDLMYELIYKSNVVYFPLDQTYTCEMTIGLSAQQNMIVFLYKKYNAMSFNMRTVVYTKNANEVGFREYKTVLNTDDFSVESEDVFFQCSLVKDLIFDYREMCQINDAFNKLIDEYRDQPT